MRLARTGTAIALLRAAVRASKSRIFYAATWRTFTDAGQQSPAMKLMNRSFKEREVLGSGQVKGGMLKAHVRWVTDNRSLAEVARFWATVPELTRAAIGSFILDVKWYSFADLMAIDRAIIDVFGGGDESLARDLGRYSARINLMGSYKAFRRAVAHEYCEKSARIHSSFQDFGNLDYRRTGDTSCHMIHSGYTSYSPLFCKSAIGYYEEAIALNGGLNVAVHETTCQCRGAAACTFIINWAEDSFRNTSSAATSL